MGLLLAIEHSGTTRQRTTNESTIEATLDEGTADSVHRDDSEIQSLTDLLV